MLNRNVVDNLPVFVEFNWTYKLLFVSCLLDQKKIYGERKLPWLDKANLEERNHTSVLTKKKKWSENSKPVVCVMLKYFKRSRYYFLWNEDIKDVIDRMHFA